MKTRQKAMMGYLAYATGKPLVKRMAKRRAKAAVHGTRGIAAFVTGLGALSGLVYWLRHRKLAA